MGEIASYLEKITHDFEDVVLKRLSESIAKVGGITDIAEYQLIRLKEMGYTTEFLKSELAKYTKKSNAEIDAVFFDVGQVSDDFYKAVYAAKGVPFVPFISNPRTKQAFKAAAKQAKKEFKNFTQSMGFTVRENGEIVFKPAAKVYQNALDVAHMQIMNGVTDYNAAVRTAVKQLTDSGIRYVDYASGWINHADVAVRRATLTGVGQVTGKITEQVLGDLDGDIVEVTAHAGARNTGDGAANHAGWQGKRYSFSGKSKKYPSLNEKTGYGTGEGLKGWNCRHDYYVVFPEYDHEPAYTQEELDNIDPPPIEYNGKKYDYYQCTQKQRQMETAIRKTKREIIGAEGSGDNETLTAKSILLRRQREEYRNFSFSANLLTQNERSQVYGFGHSQASKATARAKKKLNN